MTGGGVLIPSANVQHLMLRHDVVEELQRAFFTFIQSTSSMKGIEVLTGVNAGERDPTGNFPAGSINQRVEARLSTLAERARSFSQPPRIPGSV